MRINEKRSKDFKGKVKFYDSKKRFGFIESPDLGNLFFPFIALGTEKVQVGDSVYFNAVTSRKDSQKLEANLIRKEFISKDGYAVINRANSHLHEGVDGLLPELIGQIRCEGREFIEDQVSFDRIIGKKLLVEVSGNDEIIYAIRKKRIGHSKFVLNRNPEECSNATIVLKKIEIGYLIITAYIGDKGFPEPWDKKASKESKEFWSKHALIYGHEEIEMTSLTNECPW